MQEDTPASLQVLGDLGKSTLGSSLRFNLITKTIQETYYSKYL